MAVALTAAGYDVRLLAAREAAERAADELRGRPAEVVFLGVPDAAIADVALQLAPRLSPGALVAHLSGASTLEPLEPLRRAGHAVGSFHPLQSFAAEREPQAFRGILVALDASPPSALPRLDEIARSLGSRPRLVPPGERPLYHAAAVMAANLVVGLAAEGARALQGAGWSREEALADLLPLMTGAVANLAKEGLPEALTGPIRRGDVATVRGNLAALDGKVPEAAAVYRIVGLATLALAVEAGLDPKAASAIRTALTPREQRPGGAT